MFSQALIISSLSIKFPKAANLFVISIWHSFLTSSSLSFLKLNLSPSTVCDTYLLTASLSPTFPTSVIHLPTKFYIPDFRGFITCGQQTWSYTESKPKLFSWRYRRCLFFCFLFMNNGRQTTSEDIKSDVRFNSFSLFRFTANRPTIYPPSLHLPHLWWPEFTDFVYPYRKTTIYISSILSGNCRFSLPVGSFTLLTEPTQPMAHTRRALAITCVKLQLPDILMTVSISLFTN